MAKNYKINRFEHVFDKYMILFKILKHWTNYSLGKSVNDTVKM